MSSTDNRVVNMQFNNAQFKKGAAETQKSLADLNKATDAAGKSKGLMDVSKQMGTVALSASKMQVVTTAALATIATKATLMAGQLAKSLAINPVTSGFSEYESLLTKQNVIMNATGKSAQEVKGFLNDLNKYSDQTIYSFGNMTDSIQKFVNAGVPLPQAVTSIKGIANAAAFAGASAEEANRGMYAFSQSMQTGYIMLQDWMQIENANMGTIQFKETLLEAGEAAGTLTKQGKGWVTQSGTFVSATKGWRDGLQDQWATTTVLNDALGKYADRSTALGKKAFQSAQDVRTFTAFMDTLKESLASGWAQIFTQLFGNLEEATAMWTGLSNSVGGAVNSFFHFTVTALKTWREMGGAQKVMQGFKNILAPFGALLRAIGDAWSAAFPGSDSGAGKALYGLSAAFEAATRPLAWLADGITAATPVLTVFFKMIRIAGNILGRVGEAIGDFVGDLLELANVKAPSGGLVDFIKELASAIADAVDQIDDLLSKGASLSSAFGSVDVNLPSMPSLPSLPDIGSIFGGDDAGAQQAQVAGLAGGVKDLASNMLDLNKASEDTEKTAMFNPDAKLDTSRFSEFSGAVAGMMGEVGNATGESETIGDKLKGSLSKAFDAVVGFLKDFDLSHLVSAFNMATLATMVLSISRLFNTFGKTFEVFMGAGEAFNQIIGGVGGALQSFQTQAKAKLILNIAIAIGILAAALFVMSMIPADKLQTALTGLAGVVGAMGLTLWVFSKTMEQLDVKGMGFKMIALGIAMLALAGAVLLLSLAFIVMSKTDWDGIAKGLLTMGVLLGGLTAFGKFAQSTGGQLLGAAVAILAIGGAMLVLAGALMLFELVSWESMAKGALVLGAVALAIGLLALIPYGGIALVGVALLTASLGMLAIANALIIFGLVKWESIGKAAVMLGLLTLSLAALMFVGNPVTISGVVALSLAMIGLAIAGKIMNSVDWSSIAKIGVMMLILVVGLAALLLVLTLFAPAVLLLALFAAALLALGIALAAFAASLAIAMSIAAGGAAAFAALATAAAVAIAVFMQTLAAEAPVMKEAFLAILQTLIDTIVEAVPMVIDGIKRLWEAIKAEFGGSDKKQQMAKDGRSWIEKLADGIIEKMPMIVKKASEIIVKFINELTKYAGKIAAAGTELVAAVIRGIGNRIGKVVDAAVDLIIKFAKGITDNLARIVTAGITMVAEFLHDLADAIRNGSREIGFGLTDVISAMSEVGVNMVKGLIGGVGSMKSEAEESIAHVVLGMIGRASQEAKVKSPSRVFMKIGEFMGKGLIAGIQSQAAAAISAVASMMKGAIAMAQTLMNKQIQRMDQQAIAARARAIGLARAANKAMAAAKKTKDPKDNRSARKLAKEAKKADRVADKEAKEVRAKLAADKKKEIWENANAAKRAQIKSQEAQKQVLAAKAAEQAAEAARVEAAALEKRSKAEGLTAAQRKKFRKEAAELRKEAEKQARRANQLLNAGKISAEQAMEWQKKAGEEAAKSYQDQFEAEAKADEDAEAFEKLSASEKAKIRREEAAALQLKAEENLKKAKELAFTDLKKANELAQLALEQAERARELTDEAEEFEGQGGAGQVVDLQPTEAAALSFNEYSDIYDRAMAAAAGAQTVFNQYNTSPESLDADTIYRQSNNLLTYAADNLQPTAA